MNVRLKGGKPLCGNITVSGSKNAALPILFSLLSINGVSTLHNLPSIGDVRVALAILEYYGARIEYRTDAVKIDTTAVRYAEPPRLLTAGIRASSYLIGSSLVRFARSSLVEIGGCGFAPRPIDLHLYAAYSLGAYRKGNLLCADRLKGCELIFPKPSVGATVNSLIMAAQAEGKTVIKGYAREPHVMAVADFLTRAGAKISFSDDAITVIGNTLHGADYTVIGDMVEAGSYLSASLATDGEITVSGCDTAELSSFIDFLSRLGAKVKLASGKITVSVGEKMNYAELVAAPYPAFPTDLQPIVAPLLAIFSGGRIRDEIFPTRFGYLSELSDFGVISEISDGTAEIYPSSLHCSSCRALDLRGGMAALITALSVKGESTVTEADCILRGYSDPIANLRALGADISSI